MTDLFPIGLLKKTRYNQYIRFPHLIDIVLSKGSTLFFNHFGIKSQQLGKESGINRRSIETFLSEYSLYPRTQ